MMAIVLPLAQLMGEGSLSSYFQGTNNLGAMHATSGFAQSHAADTGYGMVAFLDHGAGGGAYIARMAVFPTLAAGARALLDLVERMVDLEHVSDATDYARQLYVHGYYTGLAAPVTPLAERAAAAAAGTLLPGDLANIDAYARLVGGNLAGAQAAVEAVPSYPGDPNALRSGPPFAPLASRLTPAGSYAPHTLEHARQLLGVSDTTAASGGISLADALAAPSGDGVWLFGRGAPSLGPALPSAAAPSPAPNVGLAVGATFVAAAAGTVLIGLLAREAGWLPLVFGKGVHA